ncbi:hypothetical protein Enr13x_09270 [Stieleria neptunia]|uniref:Uncharacterized protein n=2 Tax=Stieleria neptunia TaxID=2527979 RepID=A0A518HJU2_9BACT|nr:hypothetical protein Enr13x_09270 [Stieleria neptunia]
MFVAARISPTFCHGIDVRRIAIASLFILAFIAAAWLLAQDDGRDIPSEPPRESNRIVHPNGFSIINPNNWKSKLILASDPYMPPTIAISPRSTRVTRRYGVSLSVTQLPEDRVDIEGFRHSEFQGQPAHEHITTRDGSFMDDPPAMSYTLCFQREGIWFEIRYSIFDSYDDLPDMIESYIATFRYTKKAEQ